MMNEIIFDLKSKNIVGINKHLSNREFSITLDDINVYKTKSITYKKHKQNLSNEYLYNLFENNKIYETTNETYNGIKLSPVLKEEIRLEKYSLVKDYNKFDINDILEEKKKQLLNKYKFNNCQLWEVDFDEKIDFEYKNHLCNTGYSIIDILPNGEVKFKDLKIKCEKVKIVIETDDEILINLNGKTYHNMLEIDLEDINYISLILKNPSYNDNKSIIIKSICILY